MNCIICDMHFHRNQANEINFKKYYVQYYLITDFPLICAVLHPIFNYLQNCISFIVKSDHRTEMGKSCDIIIGCFLNL